jgi:5-hydroxyisourate hydrolase-like protein (transthyretin family)
MKRILFLSFSILIIQLTSTVACEPTIWKLKINSIFGVVVDENKTPIPNIAIQVLKNSNNENGLVSQVNTDQQGRFEFTNISSGKYIVRTSDKTYKFAFTFASLKVKQLKSKREKEIVMTVVPVSKCSGYAEVRKFSN